jgi:hypothetical protein
MVKIGFTGHQGLTRKSESLVRAAIAESLRGIKDVQGLCSLAEGSDQIFAEEVIAAGGELIVVIPSIGYENTFKTTDTLQRYRRLLEQSIETVFLDFSSPRDEAFFAAGKRVVTDSDQVIAVWDGKPAGGRGGTADVVRYAQDLGKEVVVLWPAGAVRS